MAKNLVLPTFLALFSPFLPELSQGAIPNRLHQRFIDIGGNVNKSRLFVLKNPKVIYYLRRTNANSQKNSNPY